jgi:hypothetical protein
MAKRSQRSLSQRYIHEPMSPQKTVGWWKTLASMPLCQLHEVVREATIAIRSQNPKQEVNVAASHFDSNLVCTVFKTKKGRGEELRLQTIYCTDQRCPCCPHGPYLYVYRTSKRLKTVRLRYVGIPAFSEETIDRIRDGVHLGTPYLFKPEKR